MRSDWVEDGNLRAVNFRDIEADGDSVSLPDLPELEIPDGATCEWSITWFEEAGPDKSYRRFAQTPRSISLFE